MISADLFLLYGFGFLSASEFVEVYLSEQYSDEDERAANVTLRCHSFVEDERAAYRREH